MKSLNITPLEEVTVARVKSENGAAGAKKTFDLLESKMEGLRGRKAQILKRCINSSRILVKQSFS